MDGQLNQSLGLLAHQLAFRIDGTGVGGCQGGRIPPNLRRWDRSPRVYIGRGALEELQSTNRAKVQSKVSPLDIFGATLCSLVPARGVCFQESPV